MAQANPFWGAPRIHGELLKLGLEILGAHRVAVNAQEPKAPSQTWRAFLNDHVGQLVSIDFFTVSTATFRVLFALFVLAHHRRRVLHFNVTGASHGFLDRAAGG
jgi:putative transposase